MKSLILILTWLFLLPMLASEQNAGRQYRGQGYLFFGLSPTDDVWLGSGVIKHVGFGGEGFLHKGLGLGAEAGYVYAAPYSADAWIASGDVSYHFRRSAKRGGVDPFVLGGMTGFFPTSTGRGAPAGNFGGGVNVWLTEHAALRLEFRDHVNTVGTDYPGPHYVSFRFGVTFR